jgi:hypothetical protein
MNGCKNGNSPWEMYGRMCRRNDTGGVNFICTKGVKSVDNLQLSRIGEIFLVKLLNTGIINIICFEKQRSICFINTSAATQKIYLGKS